MGVGEAGWLSSYSHAVSGFAKEGSPHLSVREARGSKDVVEAAWAPGGPAGAMDTYGWRESSNSALVLISIHISADPPVDSASA